MSRSRPSRCLSFLFFFAFDFRLYIFERRWLYSVCVLSTRRTFLSAWLRFSCSKCSTSWGGLHVWQWQQATHNSLIDVYPPVVSIVCYSSPTLTTRFFVCAPIGSLQGTTVPFLRILCTVASVSRTWEQGSSSILIFSKTDRCADRTFYLIIVPLESIAYALLPRYFYCKSIYFLVFTDTLATCQFSPRVVPYALSLASKAS